MNFNRLLEKSSFPGCSKRARWKAPEILRSEAYLAVLRNKPSPCIDTGKDKGNPAKRGTDGCFSATW
jgi:hypothetical protein